MLGTLATILKWVVLLPLVVGIVLLAIANDQSVTVHFNPFDADDPVLRLDLALYQVAFAVFALGVVVGGLIAWSGQGRYRREARLRRDDAARRHARADLPEYREADAPHSPSGALVPRAGRF